MLELLRLIVLVHRLRLVSRQRDPRKIKGLQERRLRELLLHAVRFSPFYARRFRGIDVTQCSLRDLPTVTKAEMMAHYEEVLTDRRLGKAELQDFIADPGNLGKYFLDRYAVGHTSGSQGQPAMIVQDRDAMQLAFAVQVARGSAAKRSFFPHLRRFFDPARLALYTQRPGFYPSGLGFSYLPEAARPYFKVLRLSVFDPVEETVARLNEFRPFYISGFTSSLEILAREEEAGRLKLREAGCLEQLNNFSEPLPEASARRLEKTFGVHVFNHYAMGECLALSSGCRLSTASHLNADLAILEVVDENNLPVPEGQPGRKVLLTNLYNHVQPFIRYEIDDVVTMSPTPCTCGNMLARIDSVTGRNEDALWVMENGRYRELPYYLFLAAIHHDLDIAEHQVVQTGRNEFAVRVAPLPGKALSAERIRRLVEASIGAEGMSHLVKLDIQIVDEIPRGASGKAERVRSLVGPPPTQPAHGEKGRQREKIELVGKAAAEG
jgi:phenylacetate-coenzyme A ligase PaaK-like adenylate-forming protein